MDTKKMFEKWFKETPLRDIEMKTLNVNVFKLCLKLAYEQGAHDNFDCVCDEYYLTPAVKEDGL